MLIKPILFSVPSFNADMDEAFSFRVEVGGPQVVSNKLIIRNQDNNEIVYQEIQQTYKYEHILPASTLTNGSYYNASVVIYDASGDESPESLPIQFKCYSTPTIEITNIPEDRIIPNSSFSFTFLYNQNQGEELNSYTMNLYNSQKKLLSSSGTVYIGTGVPPYSGSYIFAGFEDKSVYYIEVTGETVNRTVVKSDLIRLEIKYSKPGLFTLLNLANDCLNGCIQVSSDISIIEGETSPADPTYVYGTEISLTEEGSYVRWDKGYAIPNEFLARAWFRDPNPNELLTQFSNAQGQTIKIYFMNGYKDEDASYQQAYIQVFVDSGGESQYYICSNYVDILSDYGYYNLQLRKVGNLYEVGLFTNF